MKFLRGKKTYLGTIALGLIGLLYSMGHLDDGTARIAAVIVGTLTGVSARAAIGRSINAGNGLVGKPHAAETAERFDAAK